MKETSLLDQLEGRWALVTGASAGIGREFCHQLAAAGLHLVAVARRRPLLEALARELEEAHGVRCLPLEGDLRLAETPQRLLEAVEAQGIEIALLVNNAGVGRWGPFEASGLDDLTASLEVDALAPVALCHRFHHHLKRQAPAAAVINVSSQAALQPVPYMAVYGAAKACLHHFSLALYEEWREQGIHVQTLVPGPTQSEFDDKAGAYQSKITRRDPPAKAVRASLAGLRPGRPLVVSVRGTYTQRLFAALFPAKMVTREVAKLFRPPSRS